MLSSLRLLIVLYSAFGTIAQSSNSNSLICSPNQCLQGTSDTTIGETLLSKSAPLVQLLPGEYSTKSNPQLVQILESTIAGNLSQSPGFNLSSFNPLPLNISLQAGYVIYSNPLYAGQPTFSPLPSTQMNTSLPLPASSLVLSNNVWMALTSGSNNNSIIFWEAVPDVSQLPSAASQSLAIVDIQSYACSPACSGSAVCSTSGICNCPPGFTGLSCEVCDKGFFGPTCQPCPSQCKMCDDSISGSGQCLVPLLINAPETCNCVNGQCGTDGACACNIGWIQDANGTECAQCAPGFYLTSAGDCLVCQVGCTKCEDKTAICRGCLNGFTKDPNDDTKCSLSAAVTTKGIHCPDGSFNAGNECASCSLSCQTCKGPSSNDCVLCPPGTAWFKGSCVTSDSNGVCEGSNGMIADNNKHECDACGAKCTSCKIPNFNVGSTVSQLKCTACLPGSFLSKGHCAENCPLGSFVSPKDNLTCTACPSPCSSCSSADHCLACNPPLLASSGQCVSTCPSGTYSSSGACVKCHPDCASCSGSSFDKCLTCFPTRPVLSDGRCLPTCVQSQYFDLTSLACKHCHPSCSSCSGSDSTNCLACSDPTQVLRGGLCVSANCTGSSNVVPGLGVCLSELVQGLNSSTTTTTTDSSSSPSTPTSVSTTSGPVESSTPSVVVNGLRILWWEILLMVFGGIFIIVVIGILWRRCMRKRRVEETVKFVGAKERTRTTDMRQMRDKWIEALNDGVYYPQVEDYVADRRDDLNLNDGEYYPQVEGYMADRHDDLDRRDSRSVYSNSVYSQDMKMAWRESGTSRYSLDQKWRLDERD